MKFLCTCAGKSHHSWNEVWCIDLVIFLCQNYSKPSWEFNLGMIKVGGSQLELPLISSSLLYENYNIKLGWTHDFNFEWTSCSIYLVFERKHYLIHPFSWDIVQVERGLGFLRLDCIGLVLKNYYDDFHAGFNFFF